MDKQSLSYQTLYQEAKDRLLSSTGSFSSVQLSVSPFDHNLYLATAVSGSYVNYANPAFAFDPDEAQFKALMKVMANRASFTRPKRPVIERAERLSNGYLSPLTYIPLVPSRSGERCLKPFSPHRRLRWTLGATYDGRPAYIPEDMVYRGNSKDCLYYANSSGLSAHYDQMTAVKEAVMSLIRADACMRTWYKRLMPYTLDVKLLSEQVKSRVEYWRTNGRELVISQLDNDYGEVYLAILRGPNHPCFACGVGATIQGETDYAINEAIGSAEANFGLLSGLCDKPATPYPEGILYSLDHAIFYCDFEHSQNLGFLTARENLSRPFKRKSYDLVDLIKELKLTVCWLTPPGSTYHVVRAFSPNLVPISYGFGLEHSTHEALCCNSDSVEETKGYVPHCFYHP